MESSCKAWCRSEDGCSALRIGEGRKGGVEEAKEGNSDGKASARAISKLGRQQI